MRLFMQAAAGDPAHNPLLLADFRIVKVHGMKITFCSQKVNSNSAF